MAYKWSTYLVYTYMSQWFWYFHFRTESLPTSKTHQYTHPPASTPHAIYMTSGIKKRALQSSKYEYIILLHEPYTGLT